MRAKIEKILVDKIEEIGFNFDKDKLWKEEMFYIEEEDWDYFPTFKVVYYPDNQNEGTFEFRMRFVDIENNIYLNSPIIGELIGYRFILN